jgi:hypothetical protein
MTPITAAMQKGQGFVSQGKRNTLVTSKTKLVIEFSSRMMHFTRQSIIARRVECVILPAEIEARLG